MTYMGFIGARRSTRLLIQSFDRTSLRSHHAAILERVNASLMIGV